MHAHNLSLKAPFPFASFLPSRSTPPTRRPRDRGRGHRWSGGPLWHASVAPRRSPPEIRKSVSPPCFHWFWRPEAAQSSPRRSVTRGEEVDIRRGPCACADSRVQFSSGEARGRKEGVNPFRHRIHVTPVTRSRARTVGPVRGHRSAAGQLLSLPLGRPASRTQSPL